MLLQSLYIVRIFSRVEEFYKVGISRDTLKRFEFKTIKPGKTSSLPYIYKYDILLNHQLDYDHSLKIEKYILDFFKKKNLSYKPKHKFGGHTECLMVNPIEYFDQFLIDVDKDEYKENGLYYLINDMIESYKIKPTDFQKRIVLKNQSNEKNNNFRSGTNLINERNSKIESNKKEIQILINILGILLGIYLVFIHILPALFDFACYLGFALPVC